MKRRHRQVWTVVGVMAPLLLAVVPSAAQEGLDVIQRAIEYHGSERYEHSKTNLRLCSGSGCYEVAVASDGGLYTHRVAGPISTGHRDVEATNDLVRHWKDGVEVEVPTAEEGQKLRDWAMARIYFVFVPHRLNDPSALQYDLGTETWGERELHKIKVTFRPGSSTDAQDEFLYWFDPQTARLEQFAYSFEGSPGGLRFRRLDNYRRVGGILFFDQQNFGIDADGLSIDEVDPQFVEERMRPISTVRIDRIEVEPLP